MVEETRIRGDNRHNMLLTIVIILRCIDNISEMAGIERIALFLRGTAHRGK